jgi:hypothetical protein
MTDIYEFIEAKIDKSIDPYEDPIAFYEELEDLIPAYVLHNEDIEDYEYQYITLMRIRSNIHSSQEMFHKQANQVLESFDGQLEDMSDEEIEAVEQFAEDTARYTIGNTVLVIYTMAYELVDDLMTDLLSEVYDQELSDKGLSELENQLQSFDSRQQLLYKSGVIDQETNEQIQDIRFIRDELVHNVEPRFDLGIIDDLHDIEEIIYALNTLYEAEHGNKAFQFVDDS